MSGKLPGIPAVPPSDPAMHSFLLALKNNLELLTGQVGDGSAFVKQVEKALPLVTGTTSEDTTPPGLITGVSANASLGTIFLTWTNPNDADNDFVEIWTSPSNNRAGATRVATPKIPQSGQSGWAHSGLNTGVTRYYWLRAVDTSGNAGPWSHPDTAGFSASTASLFIDDFADSIRPVGRGASLPPAGSYPGDTFFVTPNGPFYRKISGSWTATTPASDISGQITETQISDGAITTPKLETNSVTTNKLAVGSVDASIIAAGAVQTSHLSAFSVTSTILASESVVAGKIAAGSIFADRIVTNEIDTQWLKNNSLSNAGIGDYSGNLLLGIAPYTLISSINVPIEVRGGGGAYTSISGTLYVDAVNLDTVNSVGVWVDVAVTGATSAFLTGGRMTIAPFNSNSFCVPVFFRTGASGTVALGVGGYAVLAGGSTSQAYIRQCRLVPNAIYKS